VSGKDLAGSMLRVYEDLPARFARRSASRVLVHVNEEGNKNPLSSLPERNDDIRTGRFVRQARSQVRVRPPRANRHGGGRGGYKKKLCEAPPSSLRVGSLLLLQEMFGRYIAREAISCAGKHLMRALLLSNSVRHHSQMRTSTQDRKRKNYQIVKSFIRGQFFFSHSDLCSIPSPPFKSPPFPAQVLYPPDQVRNAMK